MESLKRRLETAAVEHTPQADPLVFGDVLELFRRAWFDEDPPSWREFTRGFEVGQARALEIDRVIHSHTTDSELAAAEVKSDPKSDPKNWVTWAWIRKNVTVKADTIRATNHREKCIAQKKRKGQDAKLFLPDIEARFGKCVKSNS